MSRYAERELRHDIYKAAEAWQRRCLLEDGSIFTSKPLWTLENLEQLYRLFSEQPDVSKDKGFIEKLDLQLSGSTSEAKQLMAELLWIILLPTSRIISASQKREHILQVWKWGGEELGDSEFLAEDVLSGIGSGGPGYNNHRWRELGYGIDVFIALKKLDVNERSSMLKDPWVFAEWLESVEGTKARQFRHMLVHIIFPDQFERIFTAGDRRKVLQEFQGQKSAEINRMSNLERDKRLLDIRETLQSELDTNELDFYLSPIRERWRDRKPVINMEVLELYKTNFLIGYPGAEAFETEKYLSEERNYKLELGKLFKLINLNQPASLDLFNEFYSLFTKPLESIQRSPQNLVNWRFFDYLKHFGDDQKIYFTSMVLSLIGSNGELKDRVDEFMGQLSTLMQEVKTKPIPSKLRSMTSFFLFVSDPLKRPFVKTTDVKRSMKELIGDELSDDADQFDQVANFLDEVRKALNQAGWHPKDMVDLQSFIYTGAQTPASLATLKIELSNGAVKNGYILIPAGQTLFEDRFFGGNTDAAATFELILPDGNSVTTDIRGEGGARIRSRFGSLFRSLNIFAGDFAVLEEHGSDVFRLSFESTTKQITGNEVMDDESAIGPQPISPLNQIFFGPPGTGKTYRTIDAALQIVDPAYYAVHLLDREMLKARFDELRNESRIAFVTFHQSFSYEDFVEGIRAESDDGVLSYEVQDGIFKQVCSWCSAPSGVGIEEALQQFADDISNTKKTLKTIRGREFTISYRGRKTFGFRPLSSETEYSDYSVSIDRIKQLYKGASPKEIYNLSYAQAVLAELKENYGLSEFALTDSSLERPFVLIIDEVNRGNIASIFGELITLLESSKRAGSPEALSVTLPYSKTEFSVPGNLYVIGTMNTADRSLVHVDTALRRRFQFNEMMPDAGLLDGVSVEGVDIRRMLETINGRIELLFDREHALGHSFFLPLKEDNSIQRLAVIFQAEILPLLQEYFFDDWTRIAQILGDDPRRPDDSRLLVQKFSEQAAMRLMGPDFDAELARKSFRTNSVALLNPESYVAIYSSVDSVG